MLLSKDLSIVMDDDTPTLFLVRGEDVLARYDVRTKAWVKDSWLMKPDFMWRPVSPEKVWKITEGNLPSPNDFHSSFE